ncbi:reductase [Subtercola boreus]|uniref:Reductase n=2 Tax=Subtercola boreus TaxID=120213 RepID=A0A3E0VN58_9MICO|nr:NAD-dependent epimerase/dehydratase family protein [Subtercola boreus]RFA11151.1 reductase [Subtercola boreus]TQL53904.1 nucleoside-diphosphate-sugar epimerase [Subtercola boreus]
MRRILILGGTGWLGQEIAREAVATRAEVVCLARGISGAVPEGAVLIRADRGIPGAYDQLDGDWDDVIELSHDLELVESALEALAVRARHWTLVSTVSVYARNDEQDADESAELVEPLAGGDYGAAKVAAEGATARWTSDRLLIVRPGLIAGPGDPSDRFGYWPARLARGGNVLAPTTAGRSVQVIDVTDLAHFIVQAGHNQFAGTVNAVGDQHPMESFFTTVADVAGFDGDIHHADDEWLGEHDVKFWAGPRSLPLWLPLSDAAFAGRSNAAFRAAGGVLRSLRDTVSRTLQDEIARGMDRQRRSGLTPHEESDLLAEHDR